MTWTKLDENFADHPKILAAGPVAELLQIHALLYSNRNLTDGFIPASAVKHLTHGPCQPSVRRLIEVGIWTEVAGGYQIHDFLEYQPSKAKVLANRKQKASAGQAGGLARARALATDSLQAKSKPVPSRSVGSLDPRPIDNVLLVGTAVKKPPTTDDGLSQSLSRIQAKVGQRQ